MQRSKKIPVGDKEFTVTELSVEQIRNLLDQMETANLSTIDLLFPDSIPAAGIAESTGIPITTLETYAPSELKTIISGVEDINPFFANMITRLSKVGQGIINAKALTPPVAD